MNIETLFSNPIIKNAALGTLKKAMKQGEFTTGLILYDKEKDELSFDFKKEDMIVISALDLEFYKQAVHELLKIKETL